jgi:nucleotide-binding universal stress UspA family protein
VKMLVAIDGSASSKKAMHYGIILAKQTGSSLVLLQVIDPSAFIAPGVVLPAVTSAHYVMEAQDFFEKAAADTIEKAAAFCRKKGVRVTKVVRLGKPAEEIVREAKRKKAGLIIVASQGRSAIKAAVLGSVALGVIHRSDRIPVLVVKK